MHWGVDTWIVFGRQRGKTRAPIQGLSIRWGFSRYEVQQMTDPQIQALAAQVQANSVQIDVESSARVIAEERMDKRIGSLEAAIGGQIQSANYVPGVSGWKLNALTGDFEIHSCTLGSAANAPERQMVSVEVASWSKYDLPKNAANLLQFMQAELQRVPEEYRYVAEFEEFDTSYGDESFSSRLFLSYARLETEEEMADRLERAKVAGTRIVKAGGCTTIIVDGVVRARVGNLAAPVPEPEPFKVDGDQVYFTDAAIQDGSIASKWPAAWRVKVELGADGKPYAAGLGMGLGSNGESRPDIIVKASHMEILPDGLVKITQAPKKS
jgi:hypothetical protein